MIAIPALIFRSLTNATEPLQSPWSYWAAYFLGVAITWGTTSLVSMGLFSEDWRKATVAGIAASFSNTVLVGISIILSTFGEASAAPLFLLISVHLPLMMTVGTVLMEAAGGQRTSKWAAVRRTGAGLLRNPLMIAIVAGALWRATNLPLPSFAKSLVDMLSQAASPTALFAMGMSVNRYGVLGDARSALVIVGAKLILLPLVVYALATWVFGLPPLWVGVATIFASMPTGINAYLFATRYQVGVAATSSAIGLSTAGSALTCTLWIAMAKAVSH